MLLTVDFSHADLLPEPPGRPGIRLAFLRASDLLCRLQQLGVLPASLQALAGIPRSRRRRLWRRPRADDGSNVGGPGDALVKGPDVLRLRTGQRPRHRERYSGGNFHSRGFDVELVRIEQDAKKRTKGWN